MEKYTPVGKSLGKGGFGTVNLYRTNKDGQLVAIKQINVEHFVVTAEKLDTAEREVQALNSVSHPCIIKLIDHFEDRIGYDQFYFIVMEFCDGGNLSQLIERRRGLHFHEDRVLDVFVQLVSAVQAIHSRNIIHRDITPRNVLLTRNGTVKLADFGLMKDLGSDKSHVTNASYVGTDGYIAPEVLLDKQIDARVDIWSLGVILYEMIQFRRPFSTREEIISGKYPDDLNSVTQETGNIVKQMLMLEASHRPHAVEIIQKPFFRRKWNTVQERLNPRPSNSINRFEWLEMAPIASIHDGEYHPIDWGQMMGDFQHSMRWNKMLQDEPEQYLEFPPIILPPELTSSEIAVVMYAEKHRDSFRILGGYHDEVSLDTSPLAAQITLRIEFRKKNGHFLIDEKESTIYLQQGSVPSVGERIALGRNFPVLLEYFLPWNDLSSRIAPRVILLSIKPSGLSPDSKMNAPSPPFPDPYSDEMRVKVTKQNLTYWQGFEWKLVPFLCDENGVYFVDWNNNDEQWKFGIFGKIHWSSYNDVMCSLLLPRQYNADGLNDRVVNMSLDKRGTLLIIYMTHYNSPSENVPLTTIKCHFHVSIKFNDGTSSIDLRDEMSCQVKNSGLFETMFESGIIPSLSSSNHMAPSMRLTLTPL